MQHGDEIFRDGKGLIRDFGEVNVSVTTTNSKVIVRGDVVSIGDYWLIKKKVTNLVENGRKKIVVVFRDAKFIGSSVVGFFLKLILKDKISLKIKANDPQFYHFMEILGLTEVFQMKKGAKFYRGKATYGKARHGEEDEGRANKIQKA